MAKEESSPHTHPPAHIVELHHGGITARGDMPDPTNPLLPTRYRITHRLGKGYWSLGSISFQRESVSEVGRNGLSEDILLHIVKSRLVAHQKGLHPSDYNQEAIDAIDDAIGALSHRRAKFSEAGS